MNHSISLSCGTVIEVNELDLINIEHYKQAADHNRNGWDMAERVIARMGRVHQAMKSQMTKKQLKFFDGKVID